ncbi:amidohydrolase family protein [Actinomycetes bacterium KLBMP 9759]
MHSRTSRRRVLTGGLAVGAAGAVAAITGCAHPSTPEPPEPPVPPVAGEIAITGVTVVDASGPPRPGSTVLVSGDRITGVGPDVMAPPGARVVDGAGKYLIPGLVDAHVHSVPLERIFPALYLVHGVTTVREMGGNPAAAAFRDRVATGSAFGPRSQVASTIIDGSPSLWEGIGPPFLSVAGAAQARAAVREQKAAGADFIKIYTRLGRQEFDAIAAESRAAGIPFLGHVPDGLPIGDASDAGMRTIEHLWQFWYATSRDELRLRRAVAGTPIGPGEYGGWYAKMHAVEYAAARSVDPDRQAALFERLARNGTFATPTLSQHRIADIPSAARRDDPAHRYLPAAYLEGWATQLRLVYQQGRTPAHDRERRELFDRRLDLVPALAAAGVPLLAGTDTGTAYLMPGAALHDELALLVRAGLTPLQALRAATLEPARYLGLEHEQGTIERGKVADLVLLDADPLRDITATARISAVVARGCLLDAPMRQRMLDDVAAAAQDPAAAAAPAAAACPCCR